MIKRLLVAFTVIASSVAQAGSKLDISLKSNVSGLMDDESFSCQQTQNGVVGSVPSVHAPRVSYPSLSLKWQGINVLNINTIQIIFEGSEIPHNTYNCSLGTGEMQALFGDSLQVAAGSVVTSHPSCTIQCGGIPVNLNDSLVLSGKIVVTGYTISGGGNNILVVAEAPISVESLL